MKSKIAKLVCGLALLGAAATQAQTSISYTNSVTGIAPTSLTLNQFDTSLGTLQSMTIDLSGDFFSTFTITNTGSTAYTTGSVVRRNSDILLGVSLVDLAIDANNPNGAGNSWLAWLSNPLNVTGVNPGDTATATRSGLIDPGTVAYTDPGTLSLFTGSSTVSLDLNTISGFTMTLNGETAYASSYTTSETIKGVVTYIYTPVATPEPSTLALAGLGGLGMLWQFRRRK